MTGNNKIDLNHLWVVKIGGSIISTENEQNILNSDTLNMIAGYLKNITDPLIVVHGTGYISKKFALDNHIQHRKIEAINKQKVIDCLFMLREIHFSVLKNLVKSGIQAISVSPLSICEFSNNQINILNQKLIRSVLNSSLIPLIHGDLVLDENGDFRICSSDAFIAALLKLYPTRKLLFATDVPGVFQENPKKFQNSKQFSCIKPTLLEELSQKPEDKNDVSGAMPAKLKAINEVKNCFRECYIFNGFESESWNALINRRKQAGTLIFGQM